MCSTNDKVVLGSISLTNFIEGFVDSLNDKFGSYDVGTVFVMRQRFVSFLKKSLAKFGNVYELDGNIHIENNKDEVVYAVVACAIKKSMRDFADIHNEQILFRYTLYLDYLVRDLRMELDHITADRIADEINNLYNIAFGQDKKDLGKRF
jgi:hypothetical protein